MSNLADYSPKAVLSGVFGVDYYRVKVVKFSVDALKNRLLGFGVSGKRRNTNTPAGTALRAVLKGK